VFCYLERLWPQLALVINYFLGRLESERIMIVGVFLLVQGLEMVGCIDLYLLIE
jgi:hypothetical protein